MDDFTNDFTTDPTDPTDPDEPPPYPPLIRTQADLERLWRTLMQPLGFGDHSLWVMVLDVTGRPVPVLTEIAEIGAAPDRDGARGLAAFLHDVVAEQAPGGRLALLRTRPGRGRARPDDLAWAAALYEACAAAEVPTDVVHLATDDDVVPLPMDAVPLPASA